MEHQIRIESCWTDSPFLKLKNDYISLANTVFGPFVTERYYRLKFEDNIYGPSLVTVVYVDGCPAGTDVMWRNDLGGEKAYQTVDTCVLEEFRGKGLFKKITCHELDLLGLDAFIYGFPNVNSYPGYVKMGWQVQHLYNTLCCPPDAEAIDSDYAKWWMKAQSGIMHIRYKGTYCLIRKSKHKPVATLIGRVDKQTAEFFPETSPWCLLKCFQAKPSIYNKNKSIPLVCNQPNKEIPYWKIDAI